LWPTKTFLHKYNLQILMLIIYCICRLYSHFNWYSFWGECHHYTHDFFYLHLVFSFHGNFLSKFLSRTFPFPFSITAPRASALSVYCISKFLLNDHKDFHQTQAFCSDMLRLSSPDYQPEHQQLPQFLSEQITAERAAPYHQRLLH